MNHRLTWSLCLAFIARCGIAGAANDEEISKSPAYVQTAVITSQDRQGVILGFCVADGGGLVAVTGSSERFGAGPKRNGATKPTPHRVVWFDSDGAESRAVVLDFAATVVGAAPDGGIYAAGDGGVSLLSAAGKQVLRGRTPRPAKTDEEQAELERGILEKRDAQIAGYDKQIERLRDIVVELDAKVEKLTAEARKADDESAADEADAEADDEADVERKKRQARLTETRIRSVRTQARKTAEQLKLLESQADGLRRQSPQAAIEQALRKSRQVQGISATHDSVFLVTGEISGYGFAVWRFDASLDNPEKVLSNLVGCCGQMDVQVIGDRLAIAANRKHCVEFVSFSGEMLGTVGRRAGAGEASNGFGGCCNPMNTCVAADGSLLTSESNGVVKRFDADGTFRGTVGKAEVTAGCKNSAIAIEPDGSRLYYMDSQRGRVLVLTRAERDKAADAETGS